MKIRNLLISLSQLGILCATVSSFAMAQGKIHKLPSSLTPDDTTCSRSYKIDEVVVTGTQTPRALKNLPIITQVISHKDIERLHPRSVTDILQMSIPGTQVSMHGAQYRMSIQGLSADYILFLIDGERVSSEGNSIVDLNRLDVANIERVEIIRGAASAIYGSNAIGGVINFITRNVDKPLQISTTADWASEGMQRYHGSLALKHRAFSSLTSAGWKGIKGYDLPDGEDKKLPIPGSRTWNISEKLSYRSHDKKWDINLYGDYNRRNQDWDDKIRYLYDGYTAGTRIGFVANESNSFNLSYNLEGYDRSTYYYTATKDNIEPIFLLLTHTTRLQYNRGGDENSKIHFNAGFESVNESLRSDRFKSSDTRYHAGIYTLYAQCDWKVLPNLSLILGAREDIHSRFGGHLTPRLSMLYKADNWRVRLSYSEGFRSPSLKELYMDWDHRGMFQILGNKDLNPEKSRMIALSPEYQYKNLNITLIGYYNRISDRIYMRSESNGSIMRYVNGDKPTELWCAQAMIRWKLPFGLGIDMDYAYVHDKQTVKGKDGRTSPVSSTRPHNLTGTLSYDYKFSNYTLSANLNNRYSSKFTSNIYNQNTDNYTEVTYKGYCISRFTLSGQWKNRVKVSIGSDNLFDHVSDRINISSSLSPGRSYFASISLNY
ncbi:TonB-dependent receptor [Porphyromonas pogonae]|uniref:TonB-dependent receptor plug domain-containing protein n=1 Tax=Porphyromonas pogonae TaxID=867595 RepID=UPI002E75C2CD|nr:TonB-dependent receptor [Porphyromonas pogonae]